MFTVAELLAGLGSVSFAVTEGVLTSVPVGLPVVAPEMETVAVPPLAREPRSQLTVPVDAVHDPWLGVITVAGVPPIPKGSTSVIITPVAADGPLFVIVMVYCTGVPAVTVVGWAVT